MDHVLEAESRAFGSAFEAFARRFGLDAARAALQETAAVATPAASAPSSFTKPFRGRWADLEDE